MICNYCKEEITLYQHNVYDTENKHVYHPRCFIAYNRKNKKKELSFIDKCISGEIKDPEEEINNYIDRWHAQISLPRKSLHEYLGMTRFEYAMWLESKVTLERILDERD